MPDVAQNRSVAGGPRSLSNAAETEAQANPELARAKQTISELRSNLRTTDEQPVDAEARVNTAEQRLATVGDLVTMLSAAARRQ